MPKNFEVTVPFAGSFGMNIEAESEEDAKEKVYGVNFEMRLTNQHEEEEINKSNGITYLEIIDYEIYDHINEGNVCNVPCADIDINELDDDESYALEDDNDDDED